MTLPDYNDKMLEVLSKRYGPPPNRPPVTLSQAAAWNQEAYELFTHQALVPMSDQLQAYFASAEANTRDWRPLPYDIEEAKARYADYSRENEAWLSRHVGPVHRWPHPDEIDWTTTKRRGRKTITTYFKARDHDVHERCWGYE